MIDQVESSLRELLGCDVDIEWIDEHAEAMGYSVEGHYKITVNKDKSFDVFSDEVLESLIDPKPMAKAALLKYKPRRSRKKRWWQRA